MVMDKYNTSYEHHNQIPQPEAQVLHSYLPLEILSCSLKQAWTFLAMEKFLLALKARIISKLVLLLFNKKYSVDSIHKAIGSFWIQLLLTDKTLSTR